MILPGDRLGPWRCALRARSNRTSSRVGHGGVRSGCHSCGMPPAGFIIPLYFYLPFVSLSLGLDSANRDCLCDFKLGPRQHKKMEFSGV